MNIDSKEYTFLLHLLKLHLGKRESLHSDLEALDWGLICELARQHRIRPVVYDSLSKFYSHFTNSEIRHLKIEVLGVTAFNLQQLLELTNLLEIFKKNCVEIIPYKGLVLSQVAFGSFTMREFSDIDFLFTKKNFSTVKRILLERGYLTEKNIPTWLEKYYIYHNCEYNFVYRELNERKFHVEPHWIVGTRMLQNDIPLEDVLPLTTKETFASSSSLNLLGPEGLLLTTCIHHTSIGFPNLKSLLDIAALITKFETILNWDKMLAVSEKWKVRNILLFSVYLAHCELEAPLPNKIIALIQEKLPSQLSNNYNRYLFYKKNSPSILKYHFKRIRLQMALRENISTKTKILWFTFLYYATFRIFSLDKN